MNEKALISIIVPVYNAVNSLDRCIESVCKQTYGNLEIIAIDDGSTDGSSEKLDAWMDKDNRITVIHKLNQGGVAEARNQGLNKSSGEYIAWVDSDDWIEDDYIENLYVALYDTKADASVSYYGHEIRRRKVIEGKTILKKYMLMEISNMLWTTLIKAKFYAEERFNDYTIGEDDDMLGRIFTKIKRITVFQDHGYHYITNDSSLVHNVNYVKYRLWLENSVAQTEYLSSDYPWLKRYCNYKKLYVSSLIYHIISKEDDSFEKRELSERIKQEINKDVRFLPWTELHIGQIKEVLAAIKICIRGEK